MPYKYNYFRLIRFSKITNYVCVSFLNYRSFVNHKLFFNVLNLLKIYGKFVAHEKSLYWIVGQVHIVEVNLRFKMKINKTTFDRFKLHKLRIKSELLRRRE